MNKITKFSILDKKNRIHKFGQNLAEKWPTDRRKKRLGNQYVFVRLQIKYLSTTGLNLHEN